MKLTFHRNIMIYITIYRNTSNNNVKEKKLLKIKIMFISQKRPFTRQKNSSKKDLFETNKMKGKFTMRRIL